jgi:hypothetical protein
MYMPNEFNSAVSLNAEERPAPPEMDADDPPEADGFTQITDEIADALEKACDKATDLEALKKELEKLVTDWEPDKIAEIIAVSTFKARVQGQQDFEK